MRAATVTVHKPQAPIPHEFADVAVTAARPSRAAVTRAVLSLGSNLGDRHRPPARAPSPALADVLLVVSGVYETPPWGDADQPPYLNAAVLVARPGAPRRATGWTGPGRWRRPPAGCATRTGGSARARSTST